jgi:hypothetical protein
MNGRSVASQLQDLWSNLKSNPANATGSFQVRNQILSMAKEAGMTGETIKEHAKKHATK